MDIRRTIINNLSFQKEDILVSGRDVLEEISGHLTEKDWARIERQLRRAILSGEEEAAVRL